jgi:RimJ/RimL family protein N-acetyltransferase
MTGSAAPVLETERLILRPFRAEDVAPQAAMMADMAVMRHIGGKALAREDSWRKLLCGAGCWAIFGWGYWAIARRDDGAMIGQLGFADFKRGMTPSIENLPEMGWLLAAEAGGKGYATEAGLAALDWIDAAHGRPEVVAIIDEGNAPSIRVAEKLGFDERGPATYRDEPILLFRRRL